MPNDLRLVFQLATDAQRYFLLIAFFAVLCLSMING